MALTIVEAAKLSLGVLEQGLIEESVKHSALLEMLPMLSIVGKDYSYNRENALPSVSWRAPGDTWTESSATFTKVTTEVKILGGDVDVDKFLQTVYADVNDQRAIQLMEKMKAETFELERAFFYGDDSSNPSEPDGLHASVATGQQVHVGSSTTGAALTIAKLDEMLDKERLGAFDILFMTRAVRRRLSQYLTSIGSSFPREADMFGRMMETYKGIRIDGNDHLSQAETIASDAYALAVGGATSTVFAVRFNIMNGVHGLVSGSRLLEVEHFEKLEEKDATRDRIKWYINPCIVKSTLSVSLVDGITDVAVTA